MADQRGLCPKVGPSDLYKRVSSIIPEPEKAQGDLKAEGELSPIWRRYHRIGCRKGHVVAVAEAWTTGEESCRWWHSQTGRAREADIPPALEDVTSPPPYLGHRTGQDGDGERDLSRQGQTRGNS